MGYVTSSKTRDIVISLGDKQYEKMIVNKKQDQFMTMECLDGIEGLEGA